MLENQNWKSEISRASSREQEALRYTFFQSVTERMNGLYNRRSTQNSRSIGLQWKKSSMKVRMKSISIWRNQKVLWKLYVCNYRKQLISFWWIFLYNNLIKLYICLNTYKCYQLLHLISPNYCWWNSNFNNKISKIGNTVNYTKNFIIFFSTLQSRGSLHISSYSKPK